MSYAREPDPFCWRVDHIYFGEAAAGREAKITAAAPEGETLILGALIGLVILSWSTVRLSLVSWLVLGSVCIVLMVEGHEGPLSWSITTRLFSYSSSQQLLPALSLVSHAES